jgi:hypothetical protein
MALRHKDCYQGVSTFSWKVSTGRILAITFQGVLITGAVAFILQTFALKFFNPESPVLLMAVILWVVIIGGLARGHIRSGRKIYVDYARSFKSSFWAERNVTLNPAERILEVFSEFSKSQGSMVQEADRDPGFDYPANTRPQPDGTAGAAPRG